MASISGDLGPSDSDTLSEKFLIRFRYLLDRYIFVCVQLGEGLD